MILPRTRAVGEAVTGVAGTKAAEEVILLEEVILAAEAILAARDLVITGKKDLVPDRADSSGISVSQ